MKPKAKEAPSKSKEPSKPDKKAVEAPSESKESSKHGVDGGKKQTAQETDTIKVERKEISKKSEKGDEVQKQVNYDKSHRAVLVSDKPDMLQNVYILHTESP